LLFNAGCNGQVFSPKPWKKIDTDPSYRFREKRKIALLISKNDVTESKARL